MEASAVALAAAGGSAERAKRAKEETRRSVLNTSRYYKSFDRIFLEGYLLTTVLVLGGHWG